MSSKNRKAKNGFTIIEVVLVLAIAGLIFLMVFIALPQLQRAQRDTQRRSDLARVVTALTQYQTNNNGKMPISYNDVAICGEDEGVADIKPNDTSTYSGNKACKFIATYLNSSSSATNEFVDPDGTAYAIYFDAYDRSGVNEVTNVSRNQGVDHFIYVDFKAKCKDSASTTPSSNPRDFTVMYKLEGSGSYCTDNQ